MKVVINKDVEISDVFSNSDNYVPDWKEIYILAKRHSIINVLYPAIILLPESLRPEKSIIYEFKKAYSAGIILEANQHTELDFLKNSLQKNGIDYIVLKGSVIKNYYHEPALRSMHDIDILYKNCKLNKLKTVMDECGFSFVKSYGKEDVFIKEPYCLIEMHRELVPPDNSKYYKYASSVWNRALKDKDEWYMTSEDFYIYMIIHMAKHFAGGGIGIRFIMDLFVYNENLDEEYVNNVLQQLGLLSFNNKMRDLAKIWFGRAERTELSQKSVDIMTDFIINSGLFGTKQNLVGFSIINRKNDRKNINNGKFNKYIYILRTIFPKYSSMCAYYGPWLKKYPFLLPVAYCILNYERVFVRRNLTQKNINVMRNISEEDVEKATVIIDELELNF
ncbi:MAG: nucleotidyltransferase family protein [Eubacterium sp.]